MQKLIASEANWLKLLDRQKQVLFVAMLMHQVTSAGRASYHPQTEEVLLPRLLRQINEIQHRLASAMRHLLTEHAFADIELFIAEWALHHDDDELHNLLFQAWSHAKHHSSNNTCEHKDD